MKVCDVVLDSIWYDPRVRKQLIEYKRQGVDVCAVGLKDKRFDLEKQKTIPCEYKIVEVPKSKLQLTIVSKLFRKFQTQRLIRDAIVAYKPDIIHANDLTALIPAYAAMKKLKCSLVYDSHEINTENYSNKRQNVYSFIMKKIEGFLVHRVDLMICVSHAASDYFAQTYHINKPMVVTNCSMKSEQIENKMIWRGGRIEVLNHGLFYEGRGYDIIVAALDMLKDYPDIRLAIRGFGRMEDQLREAVSKCSNKAAFSFYPPVDTSDLIKYAANSDIGVAITVPVSLSFKLSVSNKIFEYAAAGLPVIMSDIPEHVYLNNKYGIGIVIKENSAADFAQAVLKFYTDVEFYWKCSENAKRMSNELNWENEFEKLIAEVRKIYDCKKNEGYKND